MHRPYQTSLDQYLRQRAFAFCGDIPESLPRSRTTGSMGTRDLSITALDATLPDGCSDGYVLLFWGQEIQCPRPGTTPEHRARSRMPLGRTWQREKTSYLGTFCNLLSIVFLHFRPFSLFMSSKFHGIPAVQHSPAPRELREIITKILRVSKPLARVFPLFALQVLPDGPRSPEEAYLKKLGNKGKHFRVGE